GQLASFTQAQADNFQSLILVDNELMAYETATLTGSFAYTLSYLRRGVFGTPIQAHATGAEFALVDKSLFTWSYQSADIGVPHYFKFTSFNQAGQQEQALSEVATYEYRVRSPRKPYPVKDVTAAPISGDSMFTAETFGISQAYAAKTDGGAEARALVTFNPPLSVFSKAALPPTITSVTVN